MWILESYNMECWRDGVLERWNNTKQEQYSNTTVPQYYKNNSGFTLLEVMIAMAIIAITLVVVFGSQSQSLSLANEAKFNTIAAFLAQSKMAEIEILNPEDLISDSGDFGEDFPGYIWQLSVGDVMFDRPENVSDHLKKIDLMISWGEDEQYQYRLRLYRFVPKTKS